MKNRYSLPPPSHPPHALGQDRRAERPMGTAWGLGEGTDTSPEFGLASPILSCPLHLTGTSPGTCHIGCDQAPSHSVFMPFGMARRGGKQGRKFALPLVLRRR